VVPRLFVSLDETRAKPNCLACEALQFARETGVKQILWKTAPPTKERIMRATRSITTNEQKSRRDRSDLLLTSTTETGRVEFTDEELNVVSGGIDDGTVKQGGPSSKPGRA
jgi:hypothetical protein